MLRTIMWITLCALLALPLPHAPLADALHSGTLLRMHVLAADDTDAMQALKLPVRDAVRQAYAEGADPHQTMQANAEALLPSLTSAARTAAAQAGYDGPVDVWLGTATFDARMLEGVAVPAGDYPALIVRLGSGLGHNWWGLVDPEHSLRAASCAQADGLVWDWSPGAVWQALGPELARWLGWAV